MEPLASPSDPHRDAEKGIRGCCGTAVQAMDRERVRSELSAQFSITSVFLRVSQMSKMIGLSSTSILAQMREGRFPVEHRRVGNVVLVKFEAFVDWYCASDHAVNAPVVSALKVAGSKAIEGQAADLAIYETEPLVETPRQRADRIKLSVMTSMSRASARQASRAHFPVGAEERESSAERARRINGEALEAARAIRKHR